MFTGTLQRFKEQIKANGTAMAILNFREIDLKSARIYLP